MRILLIEDETALREQTAQQLRAQNLTVDAVADGEEGLFMGCEYPYDVAIIDLGLPKLSGIDVIRQLREKSFKYPILILTARGRWQDKVEGLEAGADDYLVKPFALEELVLRLQALSRRRSGQMQKLQLADLQMDLSAREVSRGGQIIKLSPIGWQLLEVLLRHAPDAVSRQKLQMAVWGDEVPDSNSLKVHMHHLRKAIDGPFATKL